MNKEELEILLQKYMDGTLTGDERLRLERWYLHQARSGKPLEDAGVFASRLREMDIEVLADVLGNNEPGRKLLISPWTRWVAMAAAVATVVFGVWFFNYKIASQARNDGLVMNDVAPGKYGATIRLANGQIIQLDSAKRGVVVGGAAGIAYSDNTPVISNEERNLLNSKDKRSLGTRDDVVQLTATTARGQTYQFTLPDGTKVWLNADSKLEFPDQFSGKERKILMQGEAYFVVKHNDKQPFRVVSKARDGREQVVEDIGTEFNIKAYPDEPSVKTTLVEGSARVIPVASLTRHSDDRRNLLNSKDKGSLAMLEMTGKGGEGVTLTPNQQASLANGTLKVEKVDTEEVTSWKNGFFVFKSTTLESVLSQVERWYNVEVVYSSEALKKLTLSGSASRNSNVSVVLQAIENTGTAKFKIDGKKITVLK
ncbi:FecR family protein [Pedobacter sp. JY14-1]|uniref:FecR family protein n=1 Tax=Pedobacter sp. JY14-1 TaxID=3034151 RepID=UPI0023E2BA3C|nr:FecR family protein [Pedobacter sp. JY14-1]